MLCLKCNKICLCSSHLKICKIGDSDFSSDELEKIIEFNPKTIELHHINQKIIEILTILLQKTELHKIYINDINLSGDKEFLNALPYGIKDINADFNLFVIKNYPTSIKNVYITFRNCNELMYLPDSAETLSVVMNNEYISFENIPSSLKKLCISTSDYNDDVKINFNNLNESIETLKLDISQTPDTYHMIENFEIECEKDLPNIKTLKIYGNTHKYFTFTKIYNFINHCINCETLTLCTRQFYDYLGSGHEPILNYFELSCLPQSIKTVYLIIDSNDKNIHKRFKKYIAQHPEISFHLLKSNPENIKKYCEITDE